jgi:hypothetical protein
MDNTTINKEIAARLAKIKSYAKQQEPNKDFAQFVRENQLIRRVHAMKEKINGE